MLRSSLCVCFAFTGCASAPQPSRPLTQAPTANAPQETATTNTVTKKPRASGNSFSVPIPSGFERYTDSAHEAIYQKGGLILAQSSPPELPGAVQANIIIDPMPNRGLDLNDGFLCMSISNNAAKSLSGQVLGFKQVERPAGATCQVLVGGAAPNKRSTAVVVGDTSQVWMITCNYDERDTLALDACSAVLDGFAKEDPEISAALEAAWKVL